MRPRDRVLAAIRGEEVFPVPWDVMENRIWPECEAGLLRHFGLAQGDHEGLLRALGAHTRSGRPAYIGPPLEESPFQPPETFPNKKATRSIWGGWVGLNTYSDMIERPLSHVETVAEVKAHRWPDPDWFDYGRTGWFEDSPDQYPTVAQWAERHGDYARVIGTFDPLYSRITDLCGMEVGMRLMAARPDLIHALVAHIGGFLEEYYRRVARATRGHVDILAFGDDFAGQGGMLISPQRWREYFLPTYRRLFAIAHEHGMIAMMHMCGSVRPVLGDLIDAGLDVFQVVQVTASGMDPAALKREFGSHLTFYGGVDTQNLLPYGTPDDVRSEVRRLAEVMGKGGRYILCSMHLLMDDVPPANVVALYDEARSSVIRNE